MVVSAGHALCAQPSRTPKILPNYGAPLWCEESYFSAFTYHLCNNLENKLLGIIKRNLTLLRSFNSEVAHLDYIWDQFGFLFVNQSASTTFVTCF
jgi:hypothetical protein